eukprot:5976438-Amphidinium_carterae.2
MEYYQVCTKHKLDSTFTTEYIPDNKMSVNSACIIMTAALLQSIMAEASRVPSVSAPKYRSRGAQQQPDPLHTVGSLGWHEL